MLTYKQRTTREQIKRYLSDVGRRSFALISGGQIVSSMGTGLTDFALGVWVLKLTGSVSQFGFIVLLILIPPVLISPAAGVIIDRYDRRRIMLLANVGSFACTLQLAVLAARNRLSFWEIAILFGVTVCCNTIHGLAYSAAIYLLVDTKDLGRANGVAQIGGGVSTVFAPLLAGMLVLTIGLTGVLLIDCGTYLFALMTIALSSIPRAPRTSESAPASLVHEASSGLQYMWRNRGLLHLSLYLSVVNFVYAMGNVLKPPLLLSFTSAAGLGRLLSIEGVGFLLGTMVMSLSGGPSKLARGVLLTGGSQAIALILVGQRPSFGIAAGGLFLGAITLPIMMACNSTLLQRNTAPELQGRVLAASQLVIQGTQPIAVLIAGPLADKIFVPALRPNGAWALLFGPWFGVGQARGIGLMLGVASVVILVATVLAFLQRDLKVLDANPQCDGHRQPLNPAKNDGGCGQDPVWQESEVARERSGSY